VTLARANGGALVESDHFTFDCCAHGARLCALPPGETFGVSSRMRDAGPHRWRGLGQWRLLNLFMYSGGQPLALSLQGDTFFALCPEVGGACWPRLRNFS
jgi:hypothetical protein